jgi:hypothetical protein
VRTLSLLFLFTLAGCSSTPKPIERAYVEPSLPCSALDEEMRYTLRLLQACLPEEPECVRLLGRLELLTEQIFDCYYLQDGYEEEPSC